MSGYGTGPEPPHGPHRGYNGQERLVLIRLIWPWGVELRPARSAVGG